MTKDKTDKRKPRLVLDEPAQQPAELVPVVASKQLAEVFHEMARDRRIEPSGMSEMVDEVFDTSFLMDFLLDHINPEQRNAAKTFEARCQLFCNFAKAWRQEPGYSLQVLFGPFIVHTPEAEQGVLDGNQVGKPDRLDRIAAERETRE